MFVVVPNCLLLFLLKIHVLRIFRSRHKKDLTTRGIQLPLQKLFGLTSQTKQKRKKKKPNENSVVRRERAKSLTNRVKWREWKGLREFTVEIVIGSSYLSNCKPMTGAEESQHIAGRIDNHSSDFLKVDWSNFFQKHTYKSKRIILKLKITTTITFRFVITSHILFRLSIHVISSPCCWRATVKTLIS